MLVVMMKGVADKCGQVRGVLFLTNDMLVFSAFFCVFIICLLLFKSKRKYRKKVHKASLKWYCRGEVPKVLDERVK